MLHIHVMATLLPSYADAIQSPRPSIRGPGVYILHPEAARINAILQVPRFPVSGPRYESLMTRIDAELPPCYQLPREAQGEGEDRGRKHSLYTISVPVERSLRQVLQGRASSIYTVLCRRCSIEMCGLELPALKSENPHFLCDSYTIL